MSLLSVYVCLGPLGGLFPIPSYSAKFSIKGFTKTKGDASICSKRFNNLCQFNLRNWRNVVKSEALFSVPLQSFSKSSFGELRR